MRKNCNWRISLSRLRWLYLGGVALVAFVIAGCSTAPKPPAVQATEPAVPPPAPSLAAPGDDIPPGTSASVRAHLLKLRQMVQAGQISQDDYESRKNLLLNR